MKIETLKMLQKYQGLFLLAKTVHTLEGCLWTHLGTETVEFLDNIS